ncbi:MAG: transporter substrate-binding domain-containing protein [Oligoflexia bacterium]|nr:transporter substrate-binding domain-containing protein [Oligoflexia bacterium]
MPNYGIVPHIITKIYNDANVNVKYGFFPWTRSYLYVKDGTWNGSAIWGKTEEREKECFFSDVFLVDQCVLFYHVDKPINWTGDTKDLKGKTIGIVLGSAKTEILKQAEDKGILKYDTGSTDDNIFMKLLNKRIDAVDETKNVGLTYIAKGLAKGDVAKIQHTKSLGDWQYHFILSKKNVANIKYLKIFNDGFKKIKEDGTLDKMWKDFYSGAYNSTNK